MLPRPAFLLLGADGAREILHLHESLCSLPTAQEGPGLDVRRGKTLFLRAASRTPFSSGHQKPSTSGAIECADSTAVLRDSHSVRNSPKNPDDTGGNPALEHQRKTKARLAIGL